MTEAKAPLEDRRVLMSRGAGAASLSHRHYVTRKGSLAASAVVPSVDEDKEQR
jgi:hypothetical protein